MDYSCIILDKSAPLATITFNRPDVLNAMNEKFWTELGDGLEEVKSDDQIRVLIFTGAGRAFSSGADLKESGSRTGEEYRRYISRLQEISRAIIDFEKPTIAAINGFAIGSGYELALACDIRVAAKSAKLGSPEAKVSSAVTGGASRLLQQLVGSGKARELLFTAEFIDADEAQRIGLVNYSVPDVELMNTCQEMATKIAACAPRSLTLIKQGLNLANEGLEMDKLLEFEVEACLEAVSTEDRKTALENFKKRK